MQTTAIYNEKLALDGFFWRLERDSTVDAEDSWKGNSVIHYRSFRNTDPPSLVEIWNDAFRGRGAVHFRHSTPLEHYVFAKPFFDPAGLIVAEENGKRLGFVHAGFGAAEDESCLSPRSGVICAIGVLGSHQRAGIGTELLRRAEEFLRGRGAVDIYAGPIRPLNPFYLGLYGGSELPGFLASDPAAEPFFVSRGYQLNQTCQVFQCKLEKPISMADGRYSALRNRFELSIAPRKTTGTFWYEATQGLIEPFDFRLEDKRTKETVGQTTVWEMENFSWRWNQPAVGLTDILVRPELRRQGIGKFLLSQILRYLQEQFFALVEVQTVSENEPAIKLYQNIGFEQVDTGHTFRRVVSPS